MDLGLDLGLDLDLGLVVEMTFGTRLVTIVVSVFVMLRSIFAATGVVVDIVCVEFRDKVCMDVGVGVKGYGVVTVVVVGELPCEAMTETGSVGVSSVGVTDVGVG